MNNVQKICWKPADSKDEINSMMDTLSHLYPLYDTMSENAINVKFIALGKSGEVSVTIDGLEATITYDKPFHAARGLGVLLSGLVRDGEAYIEKTQLDKFGIMLDCSRNAVMTLEHLKKWMCQLALLGYNTLYLYTEDTYELPGEEYFGYLRGRYTAEELKKIDAYARQLNIEVLGCIQTLGHLANVLKWPAYKDVKDTNEVMMVDEEATYDLIDKMLTQFSACLKTRRIHIGMDEAHDLGRGVFLDKYGYKNSFELFSRHLTRVVEICKSHGLEPMIWSDMYFRLGTPTENYYDAQTVIPEEIKQSIPADVQFVHWDYYHNTEEFYLDWIDRHRDLGKEPIMASGIWTWFRWWYDDKKASQVAIPCIKACRTTGLKELFITLWGNNGAYCEYDSVLAGLAMCSEHVFNENITQGRLKKRFKAICGIEYQTVLVACDINHLVQQGDDTIDLLMWDDPILLTTWKEINRKDPKQWETTGKLADDLVKKLAQYKGITTPVDMDHAYRLAVCFQQRFTFTFALSKAFCQKNTKGLKSVQKQLPQVTDSIDELLVSIKRQWLGRNKSYGLGVLQQRLAGIKHRYGELDLQLTDYIAGKADALTEFSEGL